MLPHYYSRRNPIHSFFHKVFGWFKSFFWAFTAWAITVTLGLRGDLKPELGILEDQYVGGVLNRRGFYNLLRSGKITGIKGDVERFSSSGVILKDGQELGPFDVIVAATGYEADYGFLDAKSRAGLDVEVSGEGWCFCGRVLFGVLYGVTYIVYMHVYGVQRMVGVYTINTIATTTIQLQDDGLWLFRHVLPPAVPNLAFVGSEHHTFQNIVSSGVQAEWLARVLAVWIQP